MDLGTDLGGYPTTAPASPCAFKGCAGFFHPAGGSTGVVLCSPWGFEDLVMRTSWRRLAEAIAAAGYPCLRFDYPGTGDSLGASGSIESATPWISSIHDAADELKLRSGVRGFVFLGQSLGALLALAAAATRGDVVALQLVAPVAKGRTYLRELAATAAMVADKVGAAPDDGLSVVGFTLSPAMVADLKARDVSKVTGLRAAHAVVFDSPDRKAGAEVSEHLRQQGLAVSIRAVAPYHLMVSDATAIQPLPVTPAEIVAALREEVPNDPWPAATPPRVAPVLATDAFREEPLRFGENRRLFAILTRPTVPRPDAPAVVMLNRGLNPHIGWRRIAVDHARALAEKGVACLRIDNAGLGESAEDAGRPENLIYSDLLIADVRAALDALAERGYGRVALTGTCSGAYLALQVASLDERVTHVIAFNPQRFVWNPAESAEDVIRFGLRSMDDYLGDVRRGGALRKLVRSRRRVVPALQFLLKTKVRNGLALVPLALRSTLLRSSMAGLVQQMFEGFAKRGIAIALVFTEGDPGAHELRTYFGPRGRALAFPNVAVTFLERADHNLTSAASGARMLDCTIDALQLVATRDARRADAPPVAEPRRKACATA